MQEDLLFLSNLYNTWPWYYDSESIIEIQKKIIVMQHRIIAKNKLKGDYIHQRRKSKKIHKKREFLPEKIVDDNLA